jgi:iron complex outermembrane receptor protein
MKLLLLFFLTILNSVYAYDIDQILDLYRKENDLSNKTKNEALGHLVVYTRDDIERMQAYHLSDLIKSHRMMRYDENMFGMPDYSHEDPVPYSSDLIKIFINEHEITSSFAGSGLFIYGNIELGFVDHVEVYTGASSNHVSTEPSLITIKLYTKDPSRELGASLQGYIGSRAYNHLNASYAGIEDDLEYYLYASRTDANKKQYSHNNHTISKDYDELHALLTLSYKNIALDGEILNHKMSPLLSYSMLATPRESSMEYSLGRIGVRASFLDDDSLTLSSSFIRINDDIDFDLNGTRWSNTFSDLFVKHDTMTTTSVDDVFDLKLEKMQTYDNHHFIIGSQFRSKQLHDVVTYNKGILDDEPEFVDTKILSLYLQDDYIIDDQHIVTISGKASHYNNKSNRHDEKFETYQGRVGYIYSSNISLFKIFASYLQNPTEQYSLALSLSDELSILEIKSLTAEYQHTFDKHTFIIYGHLTNQDMPLNNMISKDISHNTNTNGASLEYNYAFDKFNTFESMIYPNHSVNSFSGDAIQDIGSFLRVINSWNKWDFFNEIIYYERLDSNIHGTDYSAAVRYHPTTDLTLSIKGTNIFNTAAKSEYQYVDKKNLAAGLQSLYYSPVDQFFSIGMEYKF